MISEKAHIDTSAKLGKNVHIGPFAVIGPHVEIGDDCWIGPHAVVNGPTKLGKGNKVFQFASIGECPQDKKYKDEPTTLEVGDHNVFRECVTVSRGTVSGGGVTKIGSNNLLMAYVHIAHDCILGNNNIFANNASLAGHVIVENYANLGGFVGIHQFCRIGSYAFCAGGSIILKDVLPFITVAGHPAQCHGLNTEGLKRNGFTPDEISTLKRAYKILFREGNTLESAVSQIKAMQTNSDKLNLMLEVIKTSTRGITR